MRYYIIAGEASGDLHGANLMKELKKLDSTATFRVWGGDLMKEAGGELVKHYRDLAFMGFTEVVMNLRTIFRNIDFCKKDIESWKPDVVVLIDYPGFNLRIAEYVHRIGIRVYYYISPQVWAWKQSRVKKIREHVDRMFVILPFEKDFYKKFDMEVDFVGHPLLDAIEQQKNLYQGREHWIRELGLKDLLVIALLPGSRSQEIETMLPLMLSVMDDFPEYQFVIAAAPSQPLDFYKRISAGKNVPVISGATYEVLSNAHSALVTSGTATLETALFNVPEVVCYKGGKISYYIARSLVKIKFISLVNLVMDREVVKELIQDELSTSRLRTELQKILLPENREKMKNDFSVLRNKLGGKGASALTAQLMTQYLNEK